VKDVLIVKVIVFKSVRQGQKLIHCLSVKEPVLNSDLS